MRQTQKRDAPTFNAYIDVISPQQDNALAFSAIVDKVMDYARVNRMSPQMVAASVKAAVKAAVKAQATTSPQSSNKTFFQKIAAELVEFARDHVTQSPEGVTALEFTVNCMEASVEKRQQAASRGGGGLSM